MGKGLGGMRTQNPLSGWPNVHPERRKLSHVAPTRTRTLVLPAKWQLTPGEVDAQTLDARVLRGGGRVGPDLRAPPQLHRPGDCPFEHDIPGPHAGHPAAGSANNPPQSWNAASDGRVIICAAMNPPQRMHSISRQEREAGDAGREVLGWEWQGLSRGTLMSQARF